jgi:hypothetical protein
MKQSVTLFTTRLIPLTMLVTEPDERAPQHEVLTTFVDGKRIARRALTEDDARDDIPEITKEPRQIMYYAVEEDPGIVAQLFVLTPADTEAWKQGLAHGSEVEEVDGVFIGTVVRTSAFRVAPDDLLREAAEHFSTILGGATVEPIEQILKRLA